MTVLDLIPGLRGIGHHRAPDRIAELESQLAQTQADNRELIAANEDLTCALGRAVIHSCQDEMRIAIAEDENRRLKAANEELRGKTIRAQAEQERLRRAVINARPRIREVPTELVRPYSPVVCLPYVSPVPHHGRHRV